MMIVAILFLFAGVVGSLLVDARSQRIAWVLVAVAGLLMLLPL